MAFLVEIKTIPNNQTRGTQAVLVMTLKTKIDNKIPKIMKIKIKEQKSMAIWWDKVKKEIENQKQLNLFHQNHLAKV